MRNRFFFRETRRRRAHDTGDYRSSRETSRVHDLCCSDNRSFIRFLNLYSCVTSRNFQTQPMLMMTML
ncbi:hypothetical protein HanRHA438_Chr17g0807881 [Helianthus annuus]|nr:hypothetical protein HanOQP8_Chr17g0656281 [Helianthus annuus]KAJ0825867.1 hypothetical protein HanRHA438_Chr17g0807881 [Helianthus annuus]